MTNTISKASLTNDVYNNFMSRIQSQVTTFSIPIDPGSITIQTYTETFPDKPSDDKSDYPIIVVNPPIKGQATRLTSGKTRVPLTIDLEVYTTQAVAADKIIDAMDEAIETYRADLRLVGIEDLYINNQDAEVLTQRGHIKLHRRVTRWGFNFTYNTTQAW